jgi:hypothetical protein
MLVLLPIFLLILLALAVTVFYRFKASMGWTWLLAVSGLLVTWVFVLLSRWMELTPIRLPNWWLEEEAAYQISFQVDSIAWTYAFSLVSILLVVVITASARNLLQGRPHNWALGMTITAAGLLAIYANDPLTLILAWTLIDLLELVFMFGGLSHPRFKQMAVLSFAARSIGTLVVIIAAFASRAEGVPLRLDQPSPEVGLALLIAAGLRLGVLPLHLPFSRELPIRRGIGTILRLVAPASSLTLLARLPATAVPPDVAPYLLVFASLAAVYGGFMWLNARDELSGRPYWMIALAGMAVGSVIRSHPEASLAWGVSLLLPGSLLFLYSARSLKITFIPILAFLGLTGLPFMPAASGWQGLVIPPINIPDILYLIAYAAVAAGFLRHLLEPGEPISSFETWIRVVFPAGLSILLVSYFLTGIFGWEGSLTSGGVWVSLIAFALTLLMYWAANFLHRAVAKGDENQRWYTIILSRIGSGLAVFFRLNWFYKLLWWISLLVQRLIQIITVILEGDGGLIWAMVLLAMLVISLQGGGAP